MPTRRNFRSRINARRVKALEQVNARVKAKGWASPTAPERKQEITHDRRRQRLAQAQYEQGVLEKRV